MTTDSKEPATAPASDVCEWTKYNKGVFATTACQKIYVMEVRGQTDDCPLCWKKIKFTEAKT